MEKYQDISEDSGLFLDNLYRQRVILQDGSLEQSAIPAKLIMHYATAHYRVRIETTEYITLLIGHYCAPLAALLHTYGCQSAVYITASNPHSQLVSSEENENANAQLHEQLTYHSSHVYPGESSDPAEKWPREASYLVLDLDSATARKIGREFAQNAIVWTGADAIPRLVLLH